MDLTWTSRLLAATAWAYRIVFLSALGVFIAVYFFLAVPSPYEVQPVWMIMQPVVLMAMLMSWRAIGHAIRPLGLAAMAILLLFALSMVEIVLRLAHSREEINAYSAQFPDPRWHRLVSTLGADGPFIVFMTIFGAVALVLVAGAVSTVLLRFRPRDPSGRTLAAQARHVRLTIGTDADAARLIAQIRARQWKGWIAAAAAVAALLAPLLLAGRERAIPGVGGLSGWLPDLIARAFTFFNDRAWAVAIAVPVAIVLWRRARWYFNPEARVVLDVDRRPPILLLRSFKDDHLAVASIDLWRRALDPVLWPVRAVLAAFGAKGAADTLTAVTRRRIEEVAAHSLQGIGPFIAIGNRGERVPELGALRAELGDDWQRYVIRWLREARLGVLVAGLTDWVQWELRTAAELGSLPRLILLLPPGRSAEIAERWQYVVRCLEGTRWHERLVCTDPARLLAVRFAHDGSVIALRSNGRTERDYDLALRMGTGMVIA